MLKFTPTTGTPTSGKYHVTFNGHAVVHGKYTISSNVITIKDTGGPGKCPATSKYAFKLKHGGKKLTFTLVSDSKSAACIGRRDVVLGHTFTKV